MSATIDLKSLTAQPWDVCVLGDGASALWAAHAAHRAGQSVLWVTDEEPGSFARSLARHGWAGQVSTEGTAVLRDLLGLSLPEGAQETAFQAVYFDARNTRRFKPFAESRPEWGEHEAALPALLKGGEGTLDLETLHDTVVGAYSGEALGAAATPGGIQAIQLKDEPAFIIVRGALLLGLQVEEGQFTAADLANPATKKTLTVKARAFILGDRGEPYDHLVKDQATADLLRAAQKGKSFRAGYSLQFRHRDFASALTPGLTVVVPLVANPSKKGAGAHVIGRFLKPAEDRLESVWFGLLPDDDLEDNNEILKRMRSAQRALDKALPGFSESVIDEVLHFEPRMLATDLVSKRHHRVLNAGVVTDVFGPMGAVERVREALRR